jgi:sortase B
LIIIGIIIIIIGIVLGGVGLRKYLAEKNAGWVYEDLKVEFDIEPMGDIPQLEKEDIEIPVDFESLTAEYPDIYAWITIPGTQIDYPIVQHESDNAYYLNHTVDGRTRIEGAIFTENYNSKDFSDPNTLIYGHNMKNGSMFKGLHKYKDKKFFSENSEILIYQEGRILRYKIFAAYVYDSRHIMLSFDFDDANIYRSYLNSVLTKKDMSSNIDTTIGVTAEDKIITLSTCNNNDSQRYLVQAVLLSIQE